MQFENIQAFNQSFLIFFFKYIEKRTLSLLVIGVEAFYGYHRKEQFPLTFNVIVYVYQRLLVPAS